MKLFILIALFASHIIAFEHDQLLLKAQASVFPKILLLDKSISQKSIDGKIIFTIIHNQDEFESAKTFKGLLLKKLQGNLGKYNFDVMLLDVDNYTQSDDSTAYYLFSTQSEAKQKVIKDSQNKSKICYSYDYKDFIDGSLFSLYIKEKIYVYLNKGSLLNYNIKFNPILYKIVKPK